MSGYIPTNMFVRAEKVAQSALPEGVEALAGENWGTRIDGNDLVIYVNGLTEPVGRISNAVLHGPSCVTQLDEVEIEPPLDDGPLWAFLLADDKSCMLLDGHEVVKEFLGGRDAEYWFSPLGPGVWFWEGTAESDGIDDVNLVGVYRRATVRNAIDAEEPEGETTCPSP